MSKFNVLVISPTPSHHPVRGNRKRILALLSSIKQAGGKIYYVYFPREWGMKIDNEEFNEMKKYWDEVFIVNPSKEVVSSTSDKNYQIDDWWDNNIGSFCNWLSWGVYFDVVIVNYVFFSKAFDFVNKNFLKVLDTHDIFADRKKMLVENNLPIDFFYTTKEQEKIALDRASVILAIKPSEAIYFRNLSSTPVIELGHFEDCKNVLPKKLSENDTIRFGYFGSENPINQENIKRFLSEIEPILINNPQKISIIIAGLISTYAINLPQAKLESVKILGKIDDPAEFYNELCDVVVSPFDFGTGLKIKTVESIAYGKPIIGTKHAFEGLQSVYPMHNYSSIHDMIEGCSLIISDPTSNIESLRISSIDLKDNIRKSYNFSIKRILDAARVRRLAFVVDNKFWEESDFYQRRTALFIRNLREYFHVHIICVDFPDQNWRAKLSDWQWGNSFYLNDLCEDHSIFVSRILNYLEPNVCIIQSPRVMKFDLCSKMNIFLDINGANLLDWVSKIQESTNNPSAEYKAIVTSFEVGAVLQSNVIGFMPDISVIPIIDFDQYIKIGSSIVILCHDPSQWASIIDLIYKKVLLSQNWGGDIDIYNENFCEDNVYYLNKCIMKPDKTLNLPLVTHNYRVCIQLGNVGSVFDDIKCGFLNQGLPLLRLSINSDEANLGEIDCVSPSELISHIGLIFSSDYIARKYSSHSNLYSKKINSLNTLINWCKKIDRDISLKVSNILN